MAVRTIKGIPQRRHTEKGEPNHLLAGEGHGRGEESGEQPRRTPRRMGSGMPSQWIREQERSPVVGSPHYREPSHKPQGEMPGDALGEVGGGHISKEGRDNTTRPEEKTSAFIVLSGEVSDDACRKRPTPSDG